MPSLDAVPETDEETNELGPYTPEQYALAVRTWSDRTERIPEWEETITNVPVGRLFYGLTNGPTVEAAWMTADLRDTLDYHGAPLVEIDCDDSVRRVYMQFDAHLRPGGWESRLIQDLDAHFAGNPGVWPQRIHGHQGADMLERFGRLGLNPSNWGRFPELRAAFERHGIPLRERNGQVTVDRNAYRPSTGLQFNPARASVAALAGQRRPRSADSSPSASRPASPSGERPAQRRRTGR